RLEQVDQSIHAALSSEAHTDEVLIARLRDEDDSLDEAELMHLGMQENYFRSLASFLYALRMGGAPYVGHAAAGLRNGEQFCLQNSFVADWWINRITRHLLDDLW